MVETSFTGKPTSYDSQAESLKDCDVVFLPIYTSEAAVFMRAATSKMKGDAIFFGCDGLDGIDTAVEGFDINTIKQEVSYLSHFTQRQRKVLPLSLSQSTMKNSTNPNSR